MPSATDVTSKFNIRLLHPSDFYSVLPSLTRLLHSAVKGGASVNFIDPENRFSEADAEAWWRRQSSDFRDGSQLLIGASHSGPNGDEDEVVGCVVLKPAPQPNQQHRAEVCKMLVHGDVQRQGLGQALLMHLEMVAASHGRWLLTLDTELNSTGQRLYERCGYIKVGAIPDYALLNDGQRYTATMILYKVLDRVA